MDRPVPIAPGAAIRRGPRAGGFQLRDIGIIPLLVSMPLMYFPKVFDGDTQPWVLIGGIIALLTFRVRMGVLKQDLPLLLLSLACIGAYAIRSTVPRELLRFAFINISFIVLWVVCRREKGDIFPGMIRVTIVVWMLVGLYQYFGTMLGLDVQLFGRFGSGNKGVPSLTAEPSFYGSYSVIQMMYLISEGRKSNRPYILGAAVSVLLSGSLLAILLLGFPVSRLKLRAKVLAFGGGILVLLLGGVLTDGISARLAVFQNADMSNPFFLYSFLIDPSLNLRVGHIYFTLWHNLLPSLTLTTPLQFQDDYNSFAIGSGLFIRTASNFILPSAGEMVYEAGIAGLALIFMIARRGQTLVKTRSAKLFKAAFIVACMLNPVPISAIFFIMYIQKKT